MLLPRAARLSRALAVASLLATLALSACSSAPSAAEMTSKSAAERDPHRDHVPLLSAVDRLSDLTPDQVARVQRIRDELHARTEPRRAAGKKLADLFATSLDEGKLDKQAIDAQLGSMMQLASDQKAAYAAAINELHALLTPAQRRELADDVKSRVAGREGLDPAPRMHRGEEWRASKGERRGTAGLVDGLALTTKQQSEYEGALGTPKAEGNQHLGRKLEGLKQMSEDFAGDAFDASHYDLGRFGPSMSQAFGDRMERFIAASIDILDPAQRTSLAAKIRARSNLG